MTDFLRCELSALLCVLVVLISHGSGWVGWWFIQRVCQ